MNQIPSLKKIARLAILAFFALAVISGVPARAELRIGFITPSSPAMMKSTKHQTAAQAFAWTQGTVTMLKPSKDGGWQTESGTRTAPEEYDVIWFHQGDFVKTGIDEKNSSDLLAYVHGGGVVLVSGAAGSWLNETGIETTALRMLSPSVNRVVSGVRVKPDAKTHPAFQGLDVTKPIPLTSGGVNAFGDFYDTAGPTGKLLADGYSNSERPVVEYTVGAGRAIFTGWRLADFTGDADPYRQNLEKFYGNLLRYLASRNKNHARLMLPVGKATYTRLMGIPFLMGSKVAPFTPSGDAAAALLVQPAKTPGGYDVAEQPAAPGTVQALALTLTMEKGQLARARQDLASRQAALDQQDQKLLSGLQVIKPEAARFAAGPLKPSKDPKVQQSVLLGRSPSQAPGDGLGDFTPVYQPVEDGGFRIADSIRRLNRPIVHGFNRVWTGDAPIFRMDTVCGNGTYIEDRVFPLWPRPDARAGNVYPSMGTLRLGVMTAGGKTVWLEELAHGVTATFHPGYTDYRIDSPVGGIKATLRIAPALDFHGMICRIAFDDPARLVWQYGGVWWQQSENNANKVQIQNQRAIITENNLPGNQVLVGWDGAGKGSAITATYGRQAEFKSDAPGRIFNITATWGVTSYDKPLADEMMARLDTPATSGWPQERDTLKKEWFDCAIGRALAPEKNFARLAAAPEAELSRTCAWWDARRAEFQIHTPDPHLNALINWERAATEYHHLGPGLVLGSQFWQVYAHISTGWYGKQWAGDHAAIADMLRLYGAMQFDDGFIPWVSPSLCRLKGENNTAYWVDQVWRQYQWTGDKAFVRQMWPIVRKAVAWMRAENDPDGDGLFRDYYEYWNCDSNGKGPKSAAPSAMSWAMLDRAARMAGVMCDAAAEKEYRALADRTRGKIFAELWREDEGRLGSIGADGLWRGHPQVWEEYLAINAGLLNPAQARSAMRWVADRYGFEPNPGVNLLACSDWWPLRWSVQWVPTGDTCLAVLGGMKGGDADLWWPYLQTAVRSAFRNDAPSISMGIANTGAGGGDREDVDSVDPYLHATVRGLFGIEPALDRGRLEICPAFPTDWTEASITMPDVSYRYERKGDQATFRIHSARPLIKIVRAGLTGEAVTTPAETDSVVTVKLGPALPAHKPAGPKPIIFDEVKKKTDQPRLTPADRQRLALLDLKGIYNSTPETVTSKLAFVYDDVAVPAPGDNSKKPTRLIAGWWHNPALLMAAAPRMVESPGGIPFLTGGRSADGQLAPANDMLALSSWAPQPLPGGVTIPVGIRCQRLWLLLQSYVHPIKNYIPNGEVVLHYAEGEPGLIQLIPPFNLDCYFQHFSLEGQAMPLGRMVGKLPYIAQEFSASTPHADALAIPCDPSRKLESLELRATCSEGVIGILG